MTLLANTKILVTRPAHQAGHLCQLIQEQGGEAIQLPAIAIVTIENNQALQLCQTQLDNLDLLIFVSANAVEKALSTLLTARKSLPSQLTVAAVGEKTASTLAQWGLSPLCPNAPFNSEALLALPQLQAVEGKKITIFRGEGGRELLAQTLQKRGATVNYVDVYRRIQPPTPIWVTHLQVDIITVTSVQILHNLFDMLAEQPWLTSTPLAVMSERICIEAKKLGVQAPLSIAPFASDKGLLEAILRLRA
jgi:uroporphyrinogen-III synthase